jgi:SAM-dependent methyltransferase
LIDRILHQLSHLFGDGPLMPQDFRQIRRRYAALSLRNQMPIWARLICLQPILKAIDSHVPAKSGRLLDLGSGYGLVSLCVASRWKGEIVGVEASHARFDIAQRAAQGVQNVTFQHGDIANISIPPCDVILLIDVLCLFPDALQGSILTKCAAALADDGMLLIKDNTTVPRWKYRYTHCEERLKLLLGAYGTRTIKRPNYREPEAWRRCIQRAGFKIRDERFVKSVAPYPGVIYVCGK